MTPTPADLAAPFLSAPIPPADEALAAVHDLDFEVREIANGKRKAGKLSLEKLAVVLSYVRSAATREPEGKMDQAVATCASGLPEGWKLVPIEPTESMHAAAVRTLVRCSGNDDFPPRVWRAMLAAAPVASERDHD